MAAEPAVLPEDVLVEVLQRLSPHSIAVSRWVCKAWRGAVDARLRSHLLSHSVQGIFINYRKHDISEFFFRPSTGPAIWGGLDFLPCKGVKVMDHCDGLVLCHDWIHREHQYVVNPATQRWARLPQRPPPGFDHTACLAFDPAASPPRYEVYLIPPMPYGKLNDKTLLETEWPPASHVMHVFSSITGRWHEKTFLREGNAAETAWGHRSRPEGNRAVYWRGALYVHVQCGFVTRMCLSDCKYQVIKMPGLSSSFPSPRLGKSTRGVYCVTSHSYRRRLQLWYLDDESCGQMKWVLKHDIDIESFGRKFHPVEHYGQQMDKHWILQDVNYHKFISCFQHRNFEAEVEEKYEWSSDDDNVMDAEHIDQEAWWSQPIGFLGFHPYKEMVFLAVALDGAVAYDWSNSKLHYLGPILPKHYEKVARQFSGIDTYFPYTPCWIYEFPRKSQHEDEQLSGNNLDSTPPQVKARWRKPVLDVFKINVCASFQEEEMQGATGLVVRDYVGSLINAQALWYAHAASLMIMEAIAIRDAVKLAMERGYHRVEIESDAQEVVKLMKKPGIGRSEIARITREVKELCNVFTSFSIAYVGRTANEAAHRCANKSSAERRSCLWINYKPQFLIDILENDRINSM